MALPSKDWEKINDCLVRLYRELDSEKQPRLMLRVLNELVPAENSALNIFTPPHELVAITIPEGVVSEDQVKAVGRYSQESPFGTYYLATQDASWRMETDFMPTEDFHKLALYQNALKPLGINHQIGGLLAVMDGVLHAVTLHRTYRPFEEHERQILNHIQPHLVNSYINAMVHSKTRHSMRQIQAAIETAPGAYGYFDAHGKVTWLQDRAKSWLTEFFPDEVRHAGNVPHSIRQLVDDSFRDNQKPKQLEKSIGKEILNACLGASPVGGWVLRLERKLKCPPPRFCPLPRFSMRKNEVLQWMVEGKRNAEIASILHLSPRTVEKHVAEILAGLKVENRATAIIRAMELCAAAYAAEQNR
jgi:DNA-binding CsgD family transcriptional regulator